MSAGTGHCVAHWLRFQHAGQTGFGQLKGTAIEVFRGDMFDHPEPAGVTLALEQVTLLTPTQPGKVIALWNNFMALARKLALPDPVDPLYLLKSPGACLAPLGVIRQPAAPGKIVFEGELGIVIGKTCTAVSEAQAPAHVFGYTCANDVTHADILHRDASFAQWARAKSFDTFCPFGPVVATGLDPASLRVTTWLDGQMRQDYPTSDMRFPVARLVSALSHDMTLLPGDLILCGTSIGVGSMKPGSTVEVEIAGIGRLSNRFQ